MYGYVETYPNNTYDCVEIPTECFTEAYKKLSNDSEGLREKKLEVFKELDFIDDHMSIEIGLDGILNEEECLHMLQVNFIELVRLNTNRRIPLGSFC